MSNQLLILKGTFASGKSTEAIRLSKSENTVIVSKDNIREMLVPDFRKNYDEFSNAFLKASVDFIYKASIICCLRGGFNVIADATNVQKPFDRELHVFRFLRKEGLAKVKFRFIYMDKFSLEECKQNNLLREYPADEKLLISIYNLVLKQKQNQI